MDEDCGKKNYVKNLFTESLFPTKKTVKEGKKICVFLVRVEREKMVGEIIK
jgi:hypothetical protein